MVDQQQIVEKFRRLARNTDDSLLEFLLRFQDDVTIPETATIVRTHFLAHDANGKPAIDKLAKNMADAVLDFCIPRVKIQEAEEHLKKTGSTSAFVSLNEQARDLFVRSDTSGEIGELLLFMLLERALQRPQLISKMAIKTNSQAHVQGSDGVHASLADDGVLDLYWGESKLYQSSSDAFKDCVGSIAPYLQPDGDERRKRDLLLVRDHLDVSQADLLSHLLPYFDEAKPESLNIRWNGSCLVGFDLENYPNIKVLDALQQEKLSKLVRKWHKTIGSRVNEFKVVAVNIDLFCIPVPSVADLRAQVMKRMGIK